MPDPTQSNSNSKVYFATKPKDEIAFELQKKIDSYYVYLKTSGRLSIYKKSYNYYYTGYFDRGRTGITGNTGEYRTMGVNQYHNIIQHLLVLATSQRPAWDSKAANDDYESKAQTILANGLLEYYMKEKDIEANLRQAVELSLLFGESFIEACWNATSGKTYGVHPDTGATIYEGDIEVSTFDPINCIRDFNKTTSKNPDWVILRKPENRFDLVAKYPEFETEILALPSAMQDSNTKLINFLSIYKYDDTDDVPVYYFYHRPCPSLPDGRLVVFSDHNTTYIDSPLPYRGIPVYRIAPGEQISTPFGYSIAFDLLPIQETVNKLYSTIMTNELQFGVQSIAVPKGSNIGHNQLAGGLNLFEFDPKSGPPIAINFTKTPPEVFNFCEQLVSAMEELSGVNSVIRGDPEASLRSGNALALVASTAVQFSQGLGASYNSLLEDLGTGIINLLIDYASVPRIATISGKNNRSLMKEFKGDDLIRINRVQIVAANPLTKTIAGRVNLAENLMQNHLITTPDEYLMVLQTGRIEPAIQGQTAELLLINSENESLSDGKQVVPIFSDNHKLHISEHRAVLASPDARLNPTLVNVVLKHMQDHINLLKTTDPNLLQFLGDPALPPTNPQPNNAGPMNAQPQGQQQAQAIKQPGMPNLPPNTPPQLQEAYQQSNLNNQP